MDRPRRRVTAATSHHDSREVGKRKSPPIENASERSSKQKKTAKKEKQKAASEDSSETSPVFIPGDVLNLVMSMLLPREMLNFCLTSKEISSFLTYEHVIHSAVVAEKVGVAIKNKVTPKSGEPSRLKCILKLVDQKKTFIPSPLRFLRLLVGTRCERPLCNNEYNMLQDLGVSLCVSCRPMFIRTVYTPKFSVGYNIDACVANEKIGRRTYTQSQPYATPSGERAGALVSNAEIEKTMWQGKTIDDHLATLKNVQGFLTDKACKDIIDLHSRALKGYAFIDEEIQLKAKILQNKKEDAARKTQRNRDAKKEKILNIIRDVRGMLDDPWKEYALAYNWNNEGKGTPDFEYPFVNELMTVYTHAVSKATDAKKQEVATAIYQVFCDAEENGFGDFSFLSGNQEENPLEAFMREGLLRDFSTPRLWLKQLDRNHLDHLRAGRLFEAVVDVFPHLDVSSYIEEFSSPAWRTTRGNYWSTSKYTIGRVDRLLLAKRIWTLEKLQSQTSAGSSYLVSIQQALDTYTELVPRVAEALERRYYDYPGKDRVKFLSVLDETMIGFLRTDDYDGLKTYFRKHFHK